jgi:hypothetical protein
MISKSMISKYGSLDSLRRLVNTDFPERAEIAQRIVRREGIFPRRSTFIARPRAWSAPKFDYYLLTGKWPSGPAIFAYPRLWWERLMRWAPTGEQLRSMAAWLECLGTMAETALKLAVICAGGYVLGEVIFAFMPGGAAWRFIEGVR